jgi:hypothetical protein
MNQTHIFMEAPDHGVDGLKGSSVLRLLVEICSDGFVTRELGFDSLGVLIHQAPTVSTPYCLCGSRPVTFATEDDPDVRQVFGSFWIEGGVDG